MKQELLEIWQQKCQNKLQELIYLYNTKYNVSIITPQISYNLRGSKAGTAHWPSNVIKLNPLLLLENTDEFIDNIVGHELAHIIVFQLYHTEKATVKKPKPHGIEWKKIMLDFGLEPKIYHHFSTKNTGNKIKYRCSCKEHYVSLKLHQNIQKNNSKYICKKCRSKIIICSDNI